MRRLLTLFLGALAALGLAACDAVTLKELKPGVSTGYDVRDKLGTPGIEWRNDDGSVTWEYTRQPEGTECFMATIGPDNILIRIENALTPANYARIEPGWTKDQVRRLLGKPRSVQAFPLKQEEVWDWRQPPDVNTEIFFNVHFDQEGRVTHTSKSQEVRG
ncbi:outer membrane protein assembly factor BamE [Zoogloea sp.]|uniref:outer membrane protein assembly factor BamE domain-containing protein n=1 Tax=Zoogloea sp. TaxID=49181 RepID=UPI002604BCDC|nr:outer membrane protein assembly factor BamE [Zoogloea sp.]MDD3355079.1 outer membrane protein assembly factor BamE [Zoogloea sp.]